MLSIAIIRDAKKQTNDIAVKACQYRLFPVSFLIAKNAAAGAINHKRKIVIEKNGTAVTTEDVLAIGRLWFGKSAIVLYTILRFRS